MPADRQNFEQVLKAVRSFVAERDWEQFHDPKNLAMAVASEAGELLSELRWVDGKDSDAHCKSEENRQAIEDEVADVAVTLLMFVDRVGIDLPAAMLRKIKKNAEKYPVDAWKGR